MPIYEYRCEVCNHTFEAIQKISDKPIRECVVCAGPVRRLLSPPALVFKGNGWYVTDYASGDRKKAMEAEKKARGEGASGGASESKTKADTKGTTD